MRDDRALFNLKTGVQNHDLTQRSALSYRLSLSGLSNSFLYRRKAEILKRAAPIGMAPFLSGSSSSGTEGTGAQRPNSSIFHEGIFLPWSLIE